MLAEKIYKIQKELEEKRMKRMREQGQAPGAPGTQPMAPQNPQQVLAQLRPQSTYMFMSILLRCQKVKKFYLRLF